MIPGVRNRYTGASLQLQNALSKYNAVFLQSICLFSSRCEIKEDVFQVHHTWTDQQPKNTFIATLLSGLWPEHTFICLFIIHSFIYSFKNVCKCIRNWQLLGLFRTIVNIHSLIHLFIHSFIHSFIQSFIHSINHLFITLSIYFICLFIYLFIYLFTYLLAF